MKKLIYIIFFGTLCFLVSCSSHRPTFKDIEKKQGNYLLSYDAFKRGSIVSINAEGKIDKTLAEVQPDVALTNALEFTTKLDSNEKFTAEQVTKITESLTVLGERTAAVNILRDALFRLEEHCINNPDNCKNNEYWKQFENIINMVKEIQITSQTQSKEKTEQEKLKFEQLKLEDKLKFGLDDN